MLIGSEVDREDRQRGRQFHKPTFSFRKESRLKTDYAASVNSYKPAVVVDIKIVRPRGQWVRT
jgi:hypothetical protein